VVSLWLDLSYTTSWDSTVAGQGDSEQACVMQDPSEAEEASGKGSPTPPDPSLRFRVAVLRLA